ncbi:putative regulatory protein, FmdB family [Desulfacinum infernum DSM 9756]|uniref:Putative regulatory protein, FmdB family n=1 Tax=Desulfacinum infernum DSM 9756 TaxID=1121391 RepID=A0A1M5G1A3_9BACT|nr:zinc ribbon domain-containing protein [Desulfacinum infernum]SHF97434.1 putative regulatory protein, FmdB family [Desulfacinum infernum DSM 9756]
MPIFEYRCRKCDHEFETFVWSSRDEESLSCPKCDAKEVKKLLSSFSSKGSLAGVLSSGCGSGGLGGFG